MTRKQLRPFPTPQQLSQLYKKPHDHWLFKDHLTRVTKTIEVANRHLKDASEIADLSCGDASIAKRLEHENFDIRLFLGDYAPGYKFTGPIEQTIDDIGFVDMFICSETLEHLIDPDRVLAQIRNHTDFLILSTPVGEQLEDNKEHIWQWEREDVEDMLHKATFTPIEYVGLEMRPQYPYCFGIWACQ